MVNDNGSKLMRYLFSLFLLTSVSYASASESQPLEQPLALEKKIQDLEKELQDARREDYAGEQLPSAKESESPMSLAPSEAGALAPIEESAADIKTPEPVRSEEYELYNQGRHYLAQQRLDLARKSFDEVVEKYDETPESILARFWIGDMFLREKNYPGASIALGQAYGALKASKSKKDFSPEAFHGEEDRLPEILSKLAFALKMINKRQDACITLRQLKKEYKKRPANLDWYVKKLSKDLKCK